MRIAAEGSFLASFFADAQGKTPEEIAAMLSADDRIDAAHGSAAEEGQSEQTGEDVVSKWVVGVWGLGIGGGRDTYTRTPGVVAPD